MRPAGRRAGAGRRQVLLVGALLAVGLAGCAEEATRTAVEDPSPEGRRVSEAVLGPVRAHVHLEPDRPRFGDRIRLRLEVEIDGATLEDLGSPMRLGHFRVRGRTETGSLSGPRLHSEFECEAERTGTNLGRFPPIAFTVDDGDSAGERHVLELPPFEVEVAGLEPGEEPELALAQAPLGPVVMSDPGDGRGHWGWWAGGAGALLLAALLLWRWRRRERPPAPVVVDPYEAAAKALEALLARGWIQEGRFGDFYLELTAIVRRTIEATTGVQAVEQTTEEFLREVAGHPAFDPARRQAMARFLEASDVVKFAAQRPSVAEVDEAVAAARDFCRPARGVAA